MRTHSIPTLAACALALCIVACVDFVQSPGHRAQGARYGAGSGGTAHLLSCPTASAVRSPIVVVGALGGVVSLGNTSISIPAGAVALPTAFQITIPAGSYMEVDIQAVGLTSFLFQQPVGITIDYSRCPAGAVSTGAALQGAYIDTGSHQILQLMGGTVDPLAQTVTFATGHLSGYAVADLTGGGVSDSTSQ